MDIKRENSSSSKRFSRSRQSAQKFQKEDQTTVHARKRRSSARSLTPRYNTRSSSMRNETSSISSSDKAKSLNIGVQNYQEETGVIPRYNTRTSASARKRQNSGRVKKRYVTRNLKTRKQRMRKRISANQTKSSENDEAESPSELITNLEDFIPQAITTEPNDDPLSSTRRLLFPNAAQNIAAFIPDQEVRVEFFVRQSDIPKLTEFLGEAIEDQTDQDVVASELCELNQSDVYFETRSRIPIKGFNQIQHKRQTVYDSTSSPDYSMELPNLRPALIDVNKITVQKIKYYFHQLSPQDQRRFLDEITTEVSQRGVLPTGGDVVKRKKIN